MKVSTRNEYGQLKSIILGRIEGANWPTGDIFFAIHKKQNSKNQPKHVDMLDLQDR